MADGPTINVNNGWKGTVKTANRSFTAGYNKGQITYLGEPLREGERITIGEQEFIATNTRKSDYIRTAHDTDLGSL
jgi:hypothetical protein